MAYLVAISLGPVQGFIAAARKTRDLWFGSFLLSEVSRATAAKLQDANAELIFPAPSALEGEGAPRWDWLLGRRDTDPSHRPAVANRILCVVEADPEQRVAEARAEAQRILDRLRRLAAEREAPRLLGAGVEVDADLWRAQIADFLEFYAAWAPLDAAGGTGYQTARRLAEDVLNGRKALRDFGAAHGVPGQAKSSLDPSLESVLVQAVTGGATPGLVKAGERLDGLSLVKRLIGRQRFVSLSRVAIDPFIRRIEAHPGLGMPGAGRRTWTDAEGTVRPTLYAQATSLGKSGAVEAFAAGPGSGIAHYAAFPFDTQLFYDDGRSDRDIAADKRTAAAAETFYRTVIALRRQEGVGELPTYLGVLVADGDRMGKAISGLADGDAHRLLSARLTLFAREAADVVRHHRGALVYAGGDDVLAFLPLDTALRCADGLRRAFVAAVQPAAGTAPISLSVGLAIGHYGTHLQDLLDWARAAEQAAKGPRNALAVALHTRAGGDEGTTVVHTWDGDPVHTRWLRWVDWLRRDLIPDAAAYELRRLERELRGLADKDGGMKREDLQWLALAEARRILVRRRAERGRRALAETQVEGLLAAAGDTLEGLRRVADELVIARRVAQAVDVAEGRVVGREVADG